MNTKNGDSGSVALTLGNYSIGLPLAPAIMRRQNGDIEVDGGGNGAGAAFTLKLYK